jgi:hypothetical protein
MVKGKLEDNCFYVGSSCQAFFIFQVA